MKVGGEGVKRGREGEEKVGEVGVRRRRGVGEGYPVDKWEVEKRARRRGESGEEECGGRRGAERGGESRARLV